MRTVILPGLLMAGLTLAEEMFYLLLREGLGVCPHHKVAMAIWMGWGWA
jgi:hypothetical protein